MSWLIGILVVGWLVLFVPMAILPFVSRDDIELTAPVMKPDPATGSGQPPAKLRPTSPAVEPVPASRRAA